jgi:two-component system response regulator HydG
MFKVLIVDDELSMHDLLRDYLGNSYAVYHAHDEKETIAILSKAPMDLIFLDINLGKEDDGITILKKIKANGNHVYVTMLTQTGDRKLIRESLSLGAIDYLKKPIERDELDFFLTKIKIRKSLEEDIIRLKHKLTEERKPVKIIGRSSLLKNVLTRVERLQGHPYHILLLGESGTGKESRQICSFRQGLEAKHEFRDIFK